jgi:hypothetical protein
MHISAVEGCVELSRSPVCLSLVLVVVMAGPRRPTEVLLVSVGDNLSARAMLAAGRVVARSDEALEAVAAARARSDPNACIAYDELRIANDARLFPAFCSGAFLACSRMT